MVVETVVKERIQLEEWPVAEPEDDVVRVLQQAVSYINRKWVRGVESLFGGYCAVGALKRGAKDLKLDESKAKTYLRKVMPPHEASIEAYNDNQVNKQPVLELFARAIELRKRELTK